MGWWIMCGSGKQAAPVKKLRELVIELSRRKVIRLMGAYIAIFWLLATGLSDILPALDFLPDWSFQAFVITGLAVIPVLAFLSWKYDFVPPHLVRDARDVEKLNPALSWAMRRHDNTDAGYLLLRWKDAQEAAQEKLSLQPIAIGREPTNDIHLPDKRVSRHHAVLWAEKGEWRVRDIGSANGTFVDHARLTEHAALPTSCQLRFHPQGPAVQVLVVKSDKTIAT